jgi:hypothetical protein
MQKPVKEGPEGESWEGARGRVETIQTIRINGDE